MQRRTFHVLCEKLKNLRRGNTNFRTAIPLEKRVAIGLYALGSSAEYRSIGNLFGIGKSTVCEIVLDFCQEVWDTLKPLHMNSFPLTREKIEELVRGFEMLGFPQCLGAIVIAVYNCLYTSIARSNNSFFFLDGCHIEVRPRAEDAVDYYNYKGWYSTVMLALVDYR